MSTTSETAIAGVRASVMVYDDGGKRWIPAGQGGQHGESKVQLFQHLRVTTYRIVARKGPDHEVVLNCPLYATMKYNKTTATFHQWRTEQRQLYGLNFVSPDEAQTFGQAILRALEALNLAASIGGAVHQQMASQNGTHDHHQHNGLPGVASAPALLRQQQPQQSGHYQQQPQYVPHATSVGDYCPQPNNQTMHPQRISQDDAQQQFHQNAAYQQQQQQLMNEAYYGVSPALHLQKHQRQPSAGSNASSSGSSGCTTSQASNLIYSTVTPTNAIPSPSRPAPPIPPPPPPTAPVNSKTPPASVGGAVPPAPPPPPPPLPNGTSSSNTMPRQPMNLVQAISAQKLRKVPSGATAGRPSAGSDEPAISKDARSASVGCVDSTISAARGANNAGFGGGSRSDMMSEMAATLARRRLLAEQGSASSSGTITNGADAAASSDSPTRGNEKGPETKQKPWETRNGSRPSLNEAPSSNTDSPKTHRKVPSGSSLSSQEDVGLSLMAGGVGAPAPIAQTTRSLSNGPTSSAAPHSLSADTLEQWKQEILNEVRREINKAKADIIDALKAELNRR